MKEQVKVRKSDEIIAKTGYWDIPFSTIKKMEEERKSVKEKVEFMRLNSKQISDIIRKW